ncbi:PTS lactose/cellobiose transporter subunit IIA [Terribacillus saccharophilus]|uniref:PTS lactose/cellobiose transporter subunit IIA n=1 Tax=Terribacillus saccharophilus TaxID=361277 RepID=A0ABX4GZF2_9BACI|nr:PTS lactose/cellobiose transporter subunit IIA [Terribacillus saccharophilus]PAD36281.1 PTS lactose/cellobiose transporter subunit IIA [Terribacillus saccharophilus]PAD96679.1 PTS lactose/cellobiose transporter subunit IIA [Terribacillus saccharophilus]PAE00255.1 PTS lactose/cellobiose transporter subunit IIA [Terribacillus saccharophilus]
MSELKLEELTEEQVCFQMILHSGNARSKVLQALRLYREGDIEKVNEMLTDAEEDLSLVHKVHFQLVQQEAAGQQQELSLLFLHAEDHFMSTLTMKEMVKEMIPIFQELKS